MSNNREPTRDRQSFWTTLPGVLTATAGLITAVTGLLGALYSTGIIGPHSSTPATQTPTVVVTEPPDGRTPSVIPTFPPSTEPSIALSTSSGPPGTQLTISGKGFSAGETVVIRFHTQEVKRVQADGQGAFSSVPVQVPSDWKFTGQFDFVATGLSSLKFATMPFQVT